MDMVFFWGSLCTHSDRPTDFSPDPRVCHSSQNIYFSAEWRTDAMVDGGWQGGSEIVLALVGFLHWIPHSSNHEHFISIGESMFEKTRGSVWL